MDNIYLFPDEVSTIQDIVEAIMDEQQGNLDME